MCIHIDGKWMRCYFSYIMFHLSNTFRHRANIWEDQIFLLEIAQKLNFAVGNANKTDFINIGPLARYRSVVIVSFAHLSTFHRLIYVLCTVSYTLYYILYNSLGSISSRQQKLIYTRNNSHSQLYTHWNNPPTIAINSHTKIAIRRLLLVFLVPRTNNSNYTRVLQQQKPLI